MGVRIGKKTVGLIVGRENLTPDLNNQDRLLDGLEDDINRLPEARLTASTDEEMQALLIEENVGKVVQFTGTSSIYETSTYYLIGE